MERMPVLPVTVGLDMSYTATGFCLKDGADVLLKTIKTKPADFDNDLDRMNHIVACVMKNIPQNVTLICIEDYFVPQSKQQFNAAIKLIGLGVLMRNCLYAAKLPFIVVSPNQLKKFATSKGNVGKGIVIREVYRKWAVECKDDNQADACALAYMARVCAYLKKTVLASEFASYQIDICKKILSERPSYNMSYFLEQVRIASSTR